MAKDRIVKPFLYVSKDQYRIDNIEDMKGVNFALGDVVDLLGYYEAGDGAHHKRKIVSEDDGSGVQLANGLWANIVHNGEVNVSWFGAKGDGVADDSDVLQKCINYSNEIIFRKKTYKCDKPITFNNNKSVDFGFSTIIFNKNAPTRITIETDGAIFKNLTVEDAGYYSLEVAGKNNVIENIISKKSKYTAFMNVGENNVFRELVSYDAGWDLASNYSENCKNAIWQNCKSYRSARHGFSTDPNSRNVKFINCIAYDTGTNLNEGKDSFHFEGSLDENYFINCKAVYTDDFYPLNNPAISSYRYFRINSSNANIQNFSVELSEKSKHFFKDKDVFVADDTGEKHTVNIIDSYIANGSIIVLGSYILKIYNSILYNTFFSKVSYSSIIDVESSHFDKDVKNGVLVDSGVFATSNIFFNNCTINNYSNFSNRVLVNAIITNSRIKSFDTVFVTNADEADSRITNSDVVVSSNVFENANVFLEEKTKNISSTDFIIRNNKFKNMTKILESAEPILSTFENNKCYNVSSVRSLDSINLDKNANSYKKETLVSEGGSFEKNLQLSDTANSPIFSLRVKDRTAGADRVAFSSLKLDVNLISASTNYVYENSVVKFVITVQQASYSQYVVNITKTEQTVETNLNIAYEIVGDIINFSFIPLQQTSLRNINAIVNFINNSTVVSKYIHIYDKPLSNAVNITSNTDKIKIYKLENNTLVEGACEHQLKEIESREIYKLDTPYHATNMKKLGILDSYHNYLTELHEYEKSQNIQSDSEIMALNVLQPPVIPTEVEAYAKEYNLI